MTLEELQTSGHILLEAVAGSHAYGLATPASDVDIRGVFMLPEEAYLGMDYVEQVSDAKNDVVYYELGRFVELLSKNNPNILELLDMPEDCIRKRSDLMDEIPVGAVLSRECAKSFAGYARAQIKKAHGLNKKILNPMDKRRKSILEFCYILQGQGSVALQDWLAERGWKQEDCGLLKLPHAGGMFALFHRENAREIGFKGVAQKDDSNDVSLSSIPKGMEPKAYMSFNLDGYARYCKDYKQYWEWVEKRNEARYQGTVEHGKNYDAKNMMHSFRLLDMAEEIAAEGRIKVRRPNREFLMKIRKGEFMYTELVDIAEKRLEKIDELYTKSDLPDRPDYLKLNQALVRMRKVYYGRGEMS